MAAVMRTHVGNVRAHNEDAAWFDDRAGVYAVADGMGGHLAGEVASAMAIDAVRRLTQREARPGITQLRAMVAQIQKDIAEHAAKNPRCSGMGTTLSMIWRAGGMMYTAHIGDSRIYRMRKGELRQLTMDHSLVEELVRAGLITREQARNHPRRNVITRALGAGDFCEADLLLCDSEPGDVWLLCSDGLSTSLPDEDIQGVLRRLPLEAAADRLIELALKAGGRDNITLVLMKDEGV